MTHPGKLHAVAVCEFDKTHIIEGLSGQVLISDQDQQLISRDYLAGLVEGNVEYVVDQFIDSGFRKSHCRVFGLVLTMVFPCIRGLIFCVVLRVVIQNACDLDHAFEGSADHSGPHRCRSWSISYQS